MVISSVELHKWVNQNKIVETARIKQIYRLDKKELLFSLNTKDGSKFLMISIPNYLFLTNHKPESDTKETGFGRWVRNNLKDGIINKVEQIASERILKLTVKEYEIYFEFFGKGNIIVTKDGEILITLEKQEMKDRNLAKGEKYELPESFDTFHANEKDIENLMKDCDLNASKFIATKLSLGGRVAKEICDTLGIDSEDKLNNIDPKKLIKVIEKITNEKADFSKFEQEFESKPKETAYSKKIKKIENIIETQKKTLDKVNEDIIKFNEIGEYIYNNYQFFEELKQVFDYATKNDKTITNEVIEKVKQKHKVNAKLKYKKPNLEVEIE